MTANIELLPLPEAVDVIFSPDGNGAALDVFTAEQVQDYARANVAHATDAKDAEIKTLRAERDSFQRVGIAAHDRAERLAEALRPLAELDLRPDGFDKRPDDQTIYARDRTAITVGHVRRARAALRDHDQEVGNG